MLPSYEVSVAKYPLILCTYIMVFEIKTIHTRTQYKRRDCILKPLTGNDVKPGT